MSSHTKGPWYSWDNGLGLIGVGKQHGNEADLFHAVGESNRDRSEDLANAKLIAAAPDLLEALECLAAEEWRDDDDPVLNSARDQARAAIARAKGEKP